MCVIAVVGVAPCQCFSPGGNQTTSPGRISSIVPSHRCAHPQPDVTINVCPNGCVCHAVRAPGSNVTLAPCTSAGSGACNNGSILTIPVNQSAGPFPEACDPALVISIFSSSLAINHLLRCFWIPLARHRNLFCRRSQFPNFFRTQLQGRPAQVLF